MSLISVTFILDACKISLFQVFLNFEKRVFDVKHAKNVQKLAPPPPTCLYSPVAPLSTAYLIKQALY